MWAIHNQTPFLAERTIVVDLNGERHWVVVVKGTFDILPDGRTVRAEEQVEPKVGPEYNGEDGVSSLRYEQDLIASKPQTDVLVNGHAYTPDGRPATSVNVGLQTPLGTKAILVHGDRVWERSISGLVAPSSAQPFVKMPIVYERAYGGFDQTDPDPTKHRLDARNPVGTGLFTARAHRAGKLLPNLEFPGKSVESAGPAGFGALCGHWKPRDDYQGTYDAHWLEHRKPLLPKDYDPRALQCAPLDQQMPHLRGGERFGVFNMTPGGGTLGFALPKHYFALTTFIGRRQLEHRCTIQTVIIEPDVPRVIVVWHSTLSCHHEVDDIDFTEIVEKPYAKV